MMNSVVVFTTATIALIFACVLGVFGLTTGVSFTDTAMVVEHRQPVGVAFGGLAFANQYNRNHEIGHTVQEDLLGALYLPIIGIPSLISAVVNNHDNHRRSWAERWATELGYGIR